MNKLKQIGLTALAGTLASMTVAQAGAVSVNGTAEMSWVSLPEHQVTGNPFGQKKNITFSGNGEFSNGWTYGITHVMNDTFTGQSSSSMNINMGGILTLAYDSGTGGYGANARDNVVPTAWEEVDYGFTTGITDVGAVSKAKGVVNISLVAPGSGSAISFSYASRMGAGAVGDGGTSGDATSNGHSGMDLSIDLWNINTKYFDLRTGAAAEKVTHLTNCSNNENNVENKVSSCGGQKGDAYAATIYQTIGIGPLSAGFQASYKDPGTSGGIENNQSWVAGVALTIGNYISVSCGRGYDEYYYSDNYIPEQNQPEGRDHEDAGGSERIHASFRGCSMAGNYGPLALKYVRNDVDNQGGGHASGRDDRGEEHQEINLSMAF
jgi:hypothetical protein